MLNMLPSFAVLYIIVTLPKSTEAGCPLSDQIETVNSCPQTAAEWKEAATRKNCKTTSHNCYSLDYHCVINAWMNETIEVCAPKVVIVGMVCAEFNFGGNRIQRNDNATCQKCPTAYNSSVAFKYPECYEYVERSKGLDTSQSNTESSYSSTYAYNKSSEQDDEQLPMGGQFNHTKNESSVAGPEAMIVIGLSLTVVIVLIISSVLLLIRRRRIRHQETRDIHVCSAVKRKYTLLFFFKFLDYKWLSFIGMLLTRCSDRCKTS
ncbi:uncharacterized protein LOC128169800 isoform X1 [Crassostrea angulata]|uniref:uncharacterized protein LOC128169800 isoform X1 n=1 Tax=Magallana angulata TaxID=2784310 RepID=UPI0022B12113|nr:uncharacterized protein LOC128169800 isoform X1 [Crassostrea angulata]